MEASRIREIALELNNAVSTHILLFEKRQDECRDEAEWEKLNLEWTQMSAEEKSEVCIRRAVNQLKTALVHLPIE